MGPPTLVDVFVAAVFAGSSAALLYWGFGLSGAVLGLVGVVLALAVPHVLSKPTGGVTGDVMGAGVLVCEAVLFALAALLWGA
jgi:cobalamin synthase